MYQLVINPLNQKSKIHKEIYGHFAEHLGRCIYEGLYVGESSSIPNVRGIRKDVVQALKEMKIPVLRWPGGCFADEYHWMDGIGPKEERKEMINTHWGGVVENNHFGTHEFMDLCEQLGCAAYVNGNLGSGSVREMSEWVEYLTFDGKSPMTELRRKNGREKPWNVEFFGVGNENWGCGGNMTPEHYANEYRRYATYCRNKDMYRIACGANAEDYKWTERVMKVLSEEAPFGAKLLEGLSVHYYTTTGGWEEKGKATEFTLTEYYALLSHALFMDELISRHSDIMNQYDPKKELGMIVDEWGTWFWVEEGTNPGFLYQQSTMRDALVAGITLNIFHKHSDRVRMANIAQMVNVLQSVILTEGEKMIKTPTYYVFKMYAEHQDNTLIDSFVQSNEVGVEEHLIPNLHQSASIGEDGTVYVSLCNLSADESCPISGCFIGMDIETVTGTILTGAMDAHNTFDQPERVKESAFNDFSITDKGVEFVLPPCSVLQFAVRGK